MPTGAGNILSAVGILAVVAGVLFLAWWVTRLIGSWGSRVPGAGRSGAGGMRLLDQMALGRGERLAVVLCGGKCLLLGVTERKITLLRELTEEEAAAYLAPAGEDAPHPPSFLEALKTTLRARAGKK